MWLAIWRETILAMAHMQTQQTCVLVHTSYRHDPWLRRFYRGSSRELPRRPDKDSRFELSVNSPRCSLAPPAQILALERVWQGSDFGVAWNSTGWPGTWRDVHTPLHGESSVTGSVSDWGFDWKNIKVYNGSVDLRLTKCNIISNQTKKCIATIISITRLTWNIKRSVEYFFIPTLLFFCSFSDTNDNYSNFLVSGSLNRLLNNVPKSIIQEEIKYVQTARNVFFTVRQDKASPLIGTDERVPKMGNAIQN